VPATNLVLVTDYAWPSLEIERRRLAEVGAELVVAERGEEAELIGLAAEADAILVNWKPIPAAALEAAGRCQVISRYGVGVDNIPVELATRLGIVVTNVPGFCEEEVADHAMALILACGRRIVSFAAETRAGAWGHAGAPGLPRLSEQVLGLVGFGRSARRVAARARGFGMTVIAYTPRLDPAALGELAGAVEVAASLEELLAGSDYVSLHAPSTADTRHLIGAEHLRAMKPDAHLINVSRGALVDQAALLRALRERWIAGAALDVLEREPPAAADRELLELPNLVVTPHVAFYSDTAIRELQESAAGNVARVLGGEVPEDVVNPQVLNSGGLRMRAR